VDLTIRLRTSLPLDVSGLEGVDWTYLGGQVAGGRVPKTRSELIHIRENS
jgi:hypothetical protein